MKVISTKIVNGKKMFLIEEPTKLFAQNGFSSNPYYVPIQGSASSENTRTKLTPKTKLTPQELDRIKNSQTSAKAMALKEAADKATRLAKSNVAYKKRIDTGIQSSQDMADETGAIGDKISLQNLPYVGKYIPNFLDATGMIGNMASGLGRIPLNLEKGNYGQATLSVAMPLGFGALAGVSANTTGEFINNIVNPLAGTGDLMNNLGNKYLPNAYKLNPWALKENPEMLLYRARPVGQNPDMNMAAQLKAKEAAGEPLKWYQKNLLNPQTNPEIIAREKYYGRWFEKDPNRLDFYIDPGRRNFADEETIEILRTKLPKSDAAKLNASQFDDAKLLSLSPETEFILPKEMINSAERFPESSWQQLIQEDRKFNTPNWLRGYKEVPKPASNFKSEIDWGKWNKEIPENKALMKEYNDIEQTAKANGTWMKNSDGSAFQGTPEQFVQQNSENFKKVFPNVIRDESGNVQKTYHGSQNTFDYFDPNIMMTGRTRGQGIYTSPFRERAASYATKGDKKVYEFYQNANKPQDIIQQFNKASEQRFKEFLEKNPKGSKDFDKKFNEFMKKEDELYNLTDEDFNLQKGYDFLKASPDEFVVPFSNYPKSAIGNNGMFDMTNPNIYKSIVGALATGTLGKQAMEKKEFGGTIKVLDTKIEGNKKMYLIED